MALSRSHIHVHTLTHTHHHHILTPLTRVEGECIDYSTQYPWSFGVLSVLMATGLHPLKDYPESYEGGNKVKYRSHDYQALPDAEQVHMYGTFGNSYMHVSRTLLKKLSWLLWLCRRFPQNV